MPKSKNSKQAKQAVQANPPAAAATAATVAQTEVVEPILSPVPVKEMTKTQKKKLAKIAREIKEAEDRAVEAKVRAMAFTVQAMDDGVHSDAESEDLELADEFIQRYYQNPVTTDSSSESEEEKVDEMEVDNLHPACAQAFKKLDKRIENLALTVRGSDQDSADCFADVYGKIDELDNGMKGMEGRLSNLIISNKPFMAAPSSAPQPQASSSIPVRTPAPYSFQGVHVPQSSSPASVAAAAARAAPASAASVSPPPVSGPPSVDDFEMMKKRIFELESGIKGVAKKYCTCKSATACARSQCGCHGERGCTCSSDCGCQKTDNGCFNPHTRKALLARGVVLPRGGVMFNELSY